MSTLLELIRQRRLELEAAIPKVEYTDDQRVRALQQLIVLAHSQGGDHAEKLAEIRLTYKPLGGYIDARLAELDQLGQ